MRAIRRRSPNLVNRTSLLGRNSEGAEIFATQFFNLNLNYFKSIYFIIKRILKTERTRRPFRQFKEVTYVSYR